MNRLFSRVLYVCSMMVAVSGSFSWAVQLEQIEETVRNFITLCATDDLSAIVHLKEIAHPVYQPVLLRRYGTLDQNQKNRMANVIAQIKKDALPFTVQKTTVNACNNVQLLTDPLAHLSNFSEVITFIVNRLEQDGGKISEFTQIEPLIQRYEIQVLSRDYINNLPDDVCGKLEERLIKLRSNDQKNLKDAQDDPTLSEKLKNALECYQFFIGILEDKRGKGGWSLGLMNLPVRPTYWKLTDYELAERHLKNFVTNLYESKHLEALQAINRTVVADITSMLSDEMAVKFFLRRNYQDLATDAMIEAVREAWRIIDIDGYSEEAYIQKRLVEKRDGQETELSARIRYHAQFNELRDGKTAPAAKKLLHYIAQTGGFALVPPPIIIIPPVPPVPPIPPALPPIDPPRGPGGPPPLSTPWLSAKITWIALPTVAVTLMGVVYWIYATQYKPVQFEDVDLVDKPDTDSKLQANSVAEHIT